MEEHNLVGVAAAAVISGEHHRIDVDRIANSVEEAVAVPADIVSCKPRPSSRATLHLTCRGRYQETEDPKHQQLVEGCGRAAQDWEIFLHQLQYLQSLVEAKEEVVGMAAVLQGHWRLTLVAIHHHPT